MLANPYYHTPRSAKTNYLQFFCIFSQILYISNAGLGNGLSRERVFEWLSGYNVSITNIVLMERKPYCFVVVASLDDAAKIIEMNGTKVWHDGIDADVEHHIYYVTECKFSSFFSEFIHYLFPLINLSVSVEPI